MMARDCFHHYVVSSVVIGSCRIGCMGHVRRRGMGGAVNLLLDNDDNIYNLQNGG